MTVEYWFFFLLFYSFLFIIFILFLYERVLVHYRNNSSDKAGRMNKNLSRVSVNLLYLVQVRIIDPSRRPHNLWTAENTSWRDTKIQSRELYLTSSFSLLVRLKNSIENGFLVGWHFDKCQPNSTYSGRLYSTVTQWDDLSVPYDRKGTLESSSV